MVRTVETEGEAEISESNEKKQPFFEFLVTSSSLSTESKVFLERQMKQSKRDEEIVSGTV